jgi:hypothetical protein
MSITASQSIQPQLRTIDGLSIRYAESEPRGDHALWLSQTNQVVAPDSVKVIFGLRIDHPENGGRISRPCTWPHPSHPG